MTPEEARDFLKGHLQLTEFDPHTCGIGRDPTRNGITFYDFSVGRVPNRRFFFVYEDGSIRELTKQERISFAIESTWPSDGCYCFNTKHILNGFG